MSNPFSFFSFGQPPDPAMLEEMRRHQETHEMEGEEHTHSVRRLLLEELDEDQLRTFQHMLHDFQHSTSGQSPIIALYEGLCVATLDFKFSRCAACGTNHDKALQEETTPTSQPVETSFVELSPPPGSIAEHLASQRMPEVFEKNPESPIKDMRPGSPVPEPSDLLTNGEENLRQELVMAAHPDPRIGHLTYKGEYVPGSGDDPFGQYRAVMNKFLLDEVYSSEDPMVLLHFVCTNCKTKYFSLGDRMLREPGKEGCPGCVHKEKWG